MIKEKDISNNENTILKKPNEMILKIGLKTAFSPSWARGGGCPVSHDDNFTGCSIIALFIQMNKSERGCKANPLLLKAFKIVYVHGHF